jgi:hypothetical protein
MPVQCAIPLYALGRDANRIVSVEALEDAIDLGRDSYGIEHESSHVRVLTVLKGDSLWPVGSIQNVLSTGSHIYGDTRRPVHLVKAGRYLLFLRKDIEKVQNSVSLENCGIIESDEASNQEVRRGIAMDDQLKGFEPTISLNGFARHAPTPFDR